MEQEKSGTEELRSNAGPSWQRRLLRLLKVAGTTAVLGYLALVVIAMFLENTLIYFPVPYPHGDWKPKGLAFEDAWFTSDDGVRLHGWYLPTKNAHAAVLFCHGNGGNLSHRIAKLHMLRHCGASVLAFDYRGYGRSEGMPNEKGILADARAARKWLADREKIAETDVVVMGESLGGAVAVDLAAKDGARAMVLESTFSSLPDVAAYHYPFLPVRWLMRSRFDSLSKIRQYHGPLLMAHGDSDTIIPLASAQRLFEAANEPKQWILMAHHDHNDLPPGEFVEALAKFLHNLPAEKP
jgi:fermentation-respiration switch protein FrsA (DUF1100 family)